MTVTCLLFASAACSGRDFTCQEDRTCGGPPAQGGSSGVGGGAAGGDSATGGSGGVPAPRLFVDPTSGQDAGNDLCSEASPCRTLKHTLPLARSGDFVELGAGEYTAVTGEDFSAPVPDGVTLEALAPASVTLVGDPGKTGLTFAGSGTVRNLKLSSFGIGLAASTGTVTAESMAITECATGVKLNAEASVSWKNSAIASSGLGFSVADLAHLSIDHGTLSGNGTVCGSPGIGQVTGDTQLELTSVTIERNLGGLFLSGASTTTISETAFSGNVLGVNGCNPNYDKPEYDVAMSDAPTLRVVDTTFTGSYSAICAAGTLTMTGGQIYGLEWDGIDVISGHTSVDGVAFVGKLTGSGINLLGGAADVKNSTFTEQWAGIRMQGATSLLVRHSDLIGGQYGFCVADPVAGKSTCDLGTAYAPGDNTIQGNAAGLYVGGGSVASTWVIQAARNTWEPSVQGADATGQMAPGSYVLSPTSNAIGNNFALVPSNIVVQF